MIDIYLKDADFVKQKESEGKFIRFNDRFFLLHFMDQVKITPEMACVISEIEGGTYVEPNMFTSKYYNHRAISVEYLSTGCKTALNCLAFPEKVFFADECGKNVLKVLFRQSQASIYFDRAFPCFFRERLTGQFRLFTDHLNGKQFDNYNDLCNEVS